jgi:hypothetical protein
MVTNGSFGGMRIDRAVGTEVIERVQLLGVEAAIGGMEARRMPCPGCLVARLLKREIDLAALLRILHTMRSTP